ncbi:hypothetical protein E8E12_003993 [Didymella heteroderae]|uniref:Myb-like domain-containing protein n=1 Tax=Didymella heteroderae TaxID=1769908 RepID=A0A9P4WPP8_9PLEO|nr:hypothetical protein E8E12_003993 [Didymella heteroderae]
MPSKTKPWKWTPENDRTLFLMMMGRGTVGKYDYGQMATALSSKTNWNAVRQRVEKFRQEQKAKFEDLGWALPDGSPAKAKAAPATPKKRKGSDEEGGDETPSKTKKPRAKKAPKSEETVHDDEEVGAVDAEEGIKEEQVDETV